VAIPARLKTHLEQTHTSFTPVTHVPARSSQYAAAVLHIPGKEVAKTVVLRAGEQVLLAVLPASYHVNLRKLAAQVGTPVELVDERECNRLFPDCQPGAVPPFGELYGLPVYLDEALADDPEIIFSAGTLSDGIRMGNSDFVHLAKPRICSFADEGEIITKHVRDNAYFERGGGK
jgi:Ala-tRNA(Pro) deacylase